MSMVTNTRKIFRFSPYQQAMRGGEHDYTKGSIREAIVLLAIPMILELVLESVFAVVDMYFVVSWEVLPFRL
jgi:Na+-driven multidrug efflux pump